jgi:type VI secretion system protein ImpL
VVDGQSLNLSPILLSQLERAAIIRTMFFDDNNKLDVQFSLQPIAMEQGVTSLTLLVNGQRIVDQPDAAGSHNLAWPNDIKSPAVTLMVTDNQGRQMSNTQEGPWALFHLLDKANLQPTNNTQNFLLTFNLDGNSARYQLLADKLINPFIPGILDQFRCPELLN